MSEEMKCPRCGSVVVFPASNPRYMHRCHICEFKWRDEKNGGESRQTEQK